MLALVLAATLVTGCRTTPAPEQPSASPAASPSAAPLPDGWIPVVRYGRYTLVELVPQAAQRDLLLQVVDVSLPATTPATVGDGLRHALARSGYRLCEAYVSAKALYAMPLPGAHYQLGPLTLREALLTLAGPAWALQVDDTTRTVCFMRHAEPAPQAAP